ncbi:hypothetical protein [Saccharopolyspora mangrovi]|uniref:Uncharacterized protein n=1 Tax=Saccharopolyspora mangrovi TaxID=3082379 RepID=A0ABU6A5C8_9PSEU|nr:hypothetical protein [Saccharopolyspora sp. S2-29]MEB3366615.1 hypothetical protein [Saccharopolyspora sp. S2-29]
MQVKTCDNDVFETLQNPGSPLTTSNHTYNQLLRSLRAPGERPSPS